VASDDLIEIIKQSLDHGKLSGTSAK